jgi:hypothetical protein
VVDKCPPVHGSAPAVTARPASCQAGKPPSKTSTSR